MKKQAIAIAIASALVSPSAFAAQDTSGMQFTSASEGFYASLRARLDFSSGDNDANIEGNSSRIGIRGSNDLGGGLSGFYQWEGGIRIAAGNHASSADLRTGELNHTSAIRIRLGHVGLRGGFGEFVVGSFWDNDYNWTHGSTDIANNYSGWLTYDSTRSARSAKSIQYTTPDLNGFQGAIRVKAASGSENDLDEWNLAGVYAVQGFTVAGSYNSQADGLTNSVTMVGDEEDPSAEQTFIQNATPNTDLSFANNAATDLDSWTLRLGYAQDNWYVNGWYGEDSVSDANISGTNFTSTRTDAEKFSIAGGITLDKVHLYALYEQRENSGSAVSTADNSPLGSLTHSDSFGTVGVQYDLGAQSRVWVEYFSQDADSSPSADDIVSVGLRHDF